MRSPFLHGFFGAPNFGDELLCRAILEAFPGIQPAFVATRDASVTDKTAAGIKVRIVPGMFSQLRFFTALPRRIWALRRSSHLLIGGGGLIQDTFSTVTIMRSAFDAALAVRFGIPFYFIGLEIGSIYHQVSIELTEFLLQNAQSVWCRDSTSVKKAIAGSGNNRTDIQEMPDVAHLFLRKWFATHPRKTDRQSHCVVNALKAHRSHPDEFVSLVRSLCAKFERVTLAAAQPGEESAWVAMIANPPPNLVIFSSGHWQPTLELLSSSDCLIAERFHYIAAGAHAGLPVVPVIITSKARHLVDSMGLAASSLESADYSADKVLKLLENARPANDSRLALLAEDLANAFGKISASAHEHPRYDQQTKATAMRILKIVLLAGFQQKFDALRRRLGSKPR